MRSTGEDCRFDTTRELDEKEDSTPKRAHARQSFEPSPLPSILRYIYIYIYREIFVSKNSYTIPIRVKTHNENALYATALLSRLPSAKRRANHQNSLVAKNYFAQQFFFDDDIENDDDAKKKR